MKTWPEPIDRLLTNHLKDRENDFKLHCSSDLTGSLRHTQLKAAGAPRNGGQDLTSIIRMQTGTLWHSFFQKMFERLPVMSEVALDKWLPIGWSGTCDWLVWSDKHKKFCLGDLKTTKGEALRWIERDGIKEEHKWQLSAYWHALNKMGLPITDTFTVHYLPLNTPPGVSGMKPLSIESEPIDEETVAEVMLSKYKATKHYLDSLYFLVEEECSTAHFSDKTEHSAFSKSSEPLITDFLNDELADVQDRIQKLSWNRDMEVFDVKLVPHWTAQFCPYATILCDCSTLGVTKIGAYSIEGEYKMREEVEPTVAPSDNDYALRRL